MIDTLAFVACESDYSSGYKGKLVVVNVANPSNPFIMSQCNMNANGRAVFATSSNIYVAASDYWEYKKGEKRKVAPLERPNCKADVEGGVRVINVSNPDSAYLVVSYDTPGSPRDIYVVGDLIYVADYDSVQILRHIRTGIEEREKLKLQSVELKVYPSPFKRQAAIEFTVPFSGNGCLEIYDAVGRKVRTLYNGILWHTTFKFYWNGKNDYGKEVAQGKYFVTLTPEGL